MASTCHAPNILDPSGEYWDLLAFTGRRNYDLGDYDGCMAAGATHCLVYLDQAMFGSCIPANCSAADVNLQSDLYNSWILGTTFPFLEAYQNEIIAGGGTPYLYATCGNNAIAWSSNSTAMVVLLSALVALVLRATMSVLTSQPQRKQRQDATEIKQTPVSALSSIWSGYLSEISLTATLPPLFGYKASTAVAVTAVRAQAKAASSGPQQQRQQQQQQRAVDLAPLHGVRVLSICLVILGHTLIFMQYTSNSFLNAMDVLKAMGSAGFQVIPSAEFAVDSFFLLSGMLAVYLMLKSLKKALPAWSDRHTGSWRSVFCCSRAASSGNGNGYASLNGGLEEGLLGTSGGAAGYAPLSTSGSLNDAGNGQGASSVEGPAEGYSALTVARVFVATYAYAIFHRYVRLVPCLAVMIGVLIYLCPLMGSGPYWNQWQGYISNCNQNAWTNFLFLNNFLTGSQSSWRGDDDDNFGSECAGWTWYLAVDFQLYLLSPLLAFVYWWRPAAGWAALTAVMAACMGATWAIISEYDVISLIQMVPTTLQNTGDYSNLFYTKPWCRAPAFLVGVGLAFMLHMKEQAAARTSKAIETAVNDDRAVEAAAADDVDESEERTRRPGRAVRIATVLTYILPRKAAEGASSPSTSTHGNTKQSLVSVLKNSLDIPAAIGLCIAFALMGWVFYAPTSAYAAGWTFLSSGYTDTSKFWSFGAQQAFTLLDRPVWALGLAILLYYCCTHRGGLVGAGLGHGFWAPLAKLTWSAYLMHIPAILVVYLSMTVVFRYNAVLMVTYYAAFCVFAFLLAAVMHLIVEVPAAAAEKSLWKVVAVLTGKGKGAESQ